MKNALHIIGLLLIMTATDVLLGQGDKMEMISLSDGTQVHLIQQTNHNSDIVKGYYLPTNLRIAKDSRNREQISFTKYKNAGEEGSIFHMLLTWGLTKSQLDELQDCMDERFDHSIKLYGSYNLISASSISVVGQGAMSKILKRAAKDINSVPLNPGQKMALSAKLNESETRAMDKFLKNNSIDKKTKMEIEFEYSLRDTFGLGGGMDHIKYKLIAMIKDIF